MKKKRKHIIFFVSILILLLGISLGGAFGVYKLLGKDMGKGTLLLGLGIFLLLVAIIVIAVIDYKQRNSVGNRINKAQKARSDAFGDSEWQTKEDLHMLHPLQDMRNLTNVGVLLNSELKAGGKLVGNYIYNRHAFICGTSRSGKTKFFLMPMLMSFAFSKIKPSVIVTDPKGEIYDSTSKAFQDNGYEVIRFNLRYPRGNAALGIEPSDCYNPMSIIYELYHKAQVESASTREDLLDRVNIYIRDLAASLCPVENKNEPSWDLGAQNLVTGIIWGMLEDSLEKEYEMTAEKFTLKQISNILTQPFELLYHFCNNRKGISLCRRLTSHVVNNESEKTRDSYLSNTNNKLNKFCDSGIEYLTHKTDFDLAAIGVSEKPIAIYLVIADEIAPRLPIITIMLMQLYNELIYQASGCNGGALPRDVYYIMDEAGTFKVPNLQNNLAISASRRIWWVIAVQELAQFNSIYGKEEAAIIMANCQLQMYIGANFPETNEYFSKLFGEQTIYSFSNNLQNGKGAFIDSMGGSTSLTKRSLVLPDKLSRIQPGELYYKCFQEQPARTKLVPIFEANFPLGKAIKSNCEVAHLDEEKLYYNLDKRQAAYYTVLNGGKGGGQWCEQSEVIDIKKSSAADIATQLKEALQAENENEFVISFYIDTLSKPEKAVKELTQYMKKWESEKKDVSLLQAIIKELSICEEKN